MDLDIIILSEVRQRQIQWCLYVKSLKNCTNELFFFCFFFLQNSNRFTDFENKLIVGEREKGRRGID